MRADRRILVRAVILATLGTVPSPASDLPAPDWMSGTWTGSSDGIEMEELWMPARGGMMLGLHRDVRGDRAESFEFLRIEVRATGLTYWASPGGQPATPFPMVTQDVRRITFENPRHDYPTRIIYWLSPDGLLHARIEGTRGGRQVGEEWSWRRLR